MRCAKCYCVETPNSVNPNQSAAEGAGRSELTQSANHCALF